LAGVRQERTQGASAVQRHCNIHGERRNCGNCGERSVCCVRRLLFVFLLKGKGIIPAQRRAGLYIFLGGAYIAPRSPASAI